MSFYIGCHLSSSKGFLAMGKQATEIGANTFQFFTRNPRGGAAKPVDPDDAAAFNGYSKEHGFGRIVAHAPYTLNPCAADDRVREFAYNTFKDDLLRMEFVPGNFYNFHPGSHVKQGAEKGIALTAELLNSVLFDGMHTTVLIETMAGKGSEIGCTFEEIRAIIDRVETGDKLDVCLDTCHVFDGGYDIVNDLDRVLGEFDRIIGLDRLKALHLNDSMNMLGSHKDRHAVIGGGNIGTEALARVMNHPVFDGKPVILETPNDLDGYKREIKLLRSLRTR